MHGQPNIKMSIILVVFWLVSHYSLLVYSEHNGDESHKDFRSFYSYLFHYIEIAFINAKLWRALTKTDIQPSICFTVYSQHNKVDFLKFYLINKFRLEISHHQAFSFKNFQKRSVKPNLAAWVSVREVYSGCVDSLLWDLYLIDNTTGMNYLTILPTLALPLHIGLFIVTDRLALAVFPIEACCF